MNNIPNVDLPCAQRFLDVVAPDEKITFQTFDDSDQGRKHLARKLHGTLTQHAPELTRLNKAGAGVFIMVNRGDGKGRTEKNVVAVRASFADCDGAPLEPLLDYAPHITIESSPGRYHAYWRMADCPLAQFSTVQHKLAVKFNSDKTVKDLPRVMRLPGFFHRKRKDAPFMTRILNVTDATPIKLADFEKMLGFAATATQQPEQSGSAVTNEGGRNQKLASIAGTLHHQGNDEAAILAKLLEHNATSCIPPLPEQEVRAIAKSISRYPRTAAADARDGTETTHSLTELGNAQRMADVHGGKVYFIPEIKSWIYWLDGCWHWDISGAAMRELAGNLAQQIYAEGARFDMAQAQHFAKWARASQSARTIDNATSLLSSQSSIRLSLAQVDAHLMLVGFDHARQVIDLRTGIARAATPADYVTKSLTPCTLGDSAKAARWQAFLGQIFDNDAELIDWLHRWCGYLLTGATSEQIFLFFFGLGANGKSVFAELLHYVLADYARTVAPETLTVGKRQAGGASPDLADLIGCRLALSTETEDGSALAESLVKAMTGGDAITTRKLYCEPLTYQPAFKLLLLGNHRPVIRGTDHGIWRRVRLVPFNKTFTEQERDLHLLDKLKAEAPHILAWMVAGCLEWQRRGLADVPAAIASQTADYRAEQDLIGLFLRECTTADTASEVDSSVLYKSYHSWALDTGLRPASAVSLGRRLTERGYLGRKSHGKRIWMGLTLNANTGVGYSNEF